MINPGPQATGRLCKRSASGKWVNGKRDELSASAAYTDEFGAHVAQLLLQSDGKKDRCMLLEEAIAGVPGRDLTWEEIVNVINDMVWEVPGYTARLFEIDEVARLWQHCQEGTITNKRFLPKEWRQQRLHDADQHTLSDPDATPTTAAPWAAACSTDASVAATPTVADSSDEAVQMVAAAPAADSAGESDSSTLSLGHKSSPTDMNEEVERFMDNVQTSIAFG